MASTSVPGYGERIRAAAAYARDCKERYETALVARNAVIVEAVDAGYAGHQAARDAGVRQPHIVRILSMSDDWDLGA